VNNLFLHAADISIALIILSFLYVAVFTLFDIPYSKWDVLPVIIGALGVLLFVVAII
jgi:hypothetical protein